MKRQSLLANALIFALVLFITTVAAFAQSGTSTVRGVVKDPQGNVVPGATVRLFDPATNDSRTTKATDEGIFTFEQVAVGDYRVEVEATGFKKAIITDVHALVSKVTPVDVTLEVGNVTETVTVASGAGEVLVNRDDATLGNNFVNQQISGSFF